MRFNLIRVRINAQGYDAFGAYYGVGAPLYWASANGEKDFYFRAESREEAKEIVRKYYPDAQFFR